MRVLENSCNMVSCPPHFINRLVMMFTAVNLEKCIADLVSIVAAPLNNKTRTPSSKTSSSLSTAAQAPPPANSNNSAQTDPLPHFPTCSRLPQQQPTSPPHHPSRSTTSARYSPPSSLFSHRNLRRPILQQKSHPQQAKLPSRHSQSSRREASSTVFYALHSCSRVLRLSL